MTQSLVIGELFRPFFQTVAASMTLDNSIGVRLLSHLVRMMRLVGFALLSCYAIVQIIEFVIGKEIVSEQEIVIVEEIPWSRAIREGTNRVAGERVLSAVPRTSSRTYHGCNQYGS